MKKGLGYVARGNWVESGGKGREGTEGPEELMNSVVCWSSVVMISPVNLSTRYWETLSEVS